MNMRVEDIARVCHEANRTVQLVQEDPAIPVARPWPMLPPSEQRIIVNGVYAVIEGATPEELHDEWCQAKIRDGWTYGDVKSVEAKTHPNLVDYDALDRAQRIKDDLFHAIVRALA